MKIRATIKKWGNSYGIVIPKTYIVDENLMADVEYIFNITRVVDNGSKTEGEPVWKKNFGSFGKTLQWRIKING